MPNPRRPLAAHVVPYGGAGLGMPTTTMLPTRQPDRRRPRAFQVVPIDWRPEGPDRIYGAGDPEPTATEPCEDC